MNTKNQVKNQNRAINKQDNDMRATVLDMELKARYWKAQYEIKHYSIEAEALEEKYLEVVKIQNDKYEQEQKRKMEQLQKIVQEASKGEAQLETA